MNPFESGTRKVIPAVLIYPKCENKVLMIHRNGSKAGDYHEGKWNGLGGKFELNESPLECARRELLEESGLDLSVDRFRPLGVLQFPNFKPHKNEDWMVYVFSAEVSAGEMDKLAPCSEGSLHWIPRSDIMGLNLWAGDQYFIPHVLEEKSFMGTIWYEGERVVRNWVTLLSS